MDQHDTMRGLRVLRGMSRAQAAKEVGVTPETIGRWERGDSEPTLPYLIAMAKAYHVSIDQLTGLASVMPRKKSLD